ncbi:M48 family metalloprotease [Novosphingobium album (ex Liu et al. 2023)]|uniref:PDZ domain-containing protein n=1 Tax=Novosphingobium album (ex Liu et al. 2023) TaxID=3031130 RepID=A0ABT5WL97_9SPHN|nr:M48 family metalloprotease [Novosphingobium album (ex Liu et al. 2023)]MDE8650486.1 hypothetical protein [Novosphingobium album (ex Liu et al. 2023)]
MTLRHSLTSAAAILAAALALPALPAHADEAKTGVLALFIAQDRAVAQVGYRLAIANADLCPRQRFLPGFTVTSPVQYALDYRPDFTALTRLDKGFAIAAIAADSPAARAGLRQGDRLIAIDRAPPPAADGKEADYAPIETANALIDTAMSDGVLNLAVERDGARLDITISPARGCDLTWQVIGGEGWNASTDGRLVTLRSGIVAGTADDAELAVVMGHELAHNLYADPIARGDVAGGIERRADVVGLYLMARAGYDPQAGPRFWRRFGARHPIHALGSLGHASPKQRGTLLDDTARDIARRRSAHGELWPDSYARPGAADQTLRP